MINVTFSPVRNPRTEDGQWEDMKGCHGCKQISSAYVKLDIYQDHSLIAQNICLCKGCLCDGEGLINEMILKQCA